MAVADKLQIKRGQRVAILRAPADVELELAGAGDTSVAGAGDAPVAGAGDAPVAGAGDAAAPDAVLLFVANAAELAEHGGPLVDAGKRDALAWIAYPKAGQLGTDLNRDVLAALLTERGVRPVRQISIDGVWSALRVRPAA